MGVLEDLADELARETLEGAAKVGLDQHETDDLVKDVAKSLGASSTTLEETYLTSIRIRLAERRGRAFLIKSLKEEITKRKKPPEASDG